MFMYDTAIVYNINANENIPESPPKKWEGVSALSRCLPLYSYIYLHF